MLIGMLLLLPRVVERIVQCALFPPVQFILLGMIPTHAKDESREGAVITTKEHSAFRRNELINHTIEIRIDILQLLLEIFQKHQVIMLRQWLEPRHTLMIRGNKHRRLIRNLLFAILVNFIRLQSRIFVLEIATSNVEGIEFSVGVGGGVAIACAVS